MAMKSTVDQIRQRFDQDVERFSDLSTGQSATMDTRLVMELTAAEVAELRAAGEARLRVVMTAIEN